MSIHGIDVSQHQGSIDWRKVKASGIQFAMLRAGYGASTVDGEFERNARLRIHTGDGPPGGGEMHFRDPGV